MDFIGWNDLKSLLMMMKPGSLSSNRLKKIEQALHVERNKLEVKIRSREQGVESSSRGGDRFVEKWDEELEELTAKLKNLREKTGSERSDYVAELQGELEKREALIEELRGANERLVEQAGFEKADLEARIGVLSSQLKEKEVEIKGLKKGLEGSFKTLNSTIESGEKNTQNMREHIHDLEEALAIRDQELTQKEASIFELKAGIKEREQNLGGLERHGAMLKSRKEELKNRMEGEINRLQRTLGTSEAEIMALKKDLAEIKEELRNAMNEGKASGKAKMALEKELNSLRKQSENLKNTLNRRNSEYDELKDRLTSQERKQKAEEREYLSELKGLRRDLGYREKEAQALKDKLETWHSVIRNELDSAIDFITRQSEEIADLKAALEAKDMLLKEGKGLLNLE